MVSVQRRYGRLTAVIARCFAAHGAGLVLRRLWKEMTDTRSLRFKPVGGWRGDVVKLDGVNYWDTLHYMPEADIYSSC